MTRIHPTAVVDPAAELDPTVEVGPYAIVGPHVRMAAGVVLRPHAHVTGHSEIGRETTIFPFASVGEEPQDKKYRGEPTRLVIGGRNTIREYCTLHPGTAAGGGLTSVGDDNLLMVGVHIAHDCQIGSHIVMANNVQLAGHVRVEDYAVLGASVHSHQFCRIGESAMLAALAAISQDVAPFVIAHGFRARVIKVNRVNMERRGFSSAQMEAVERAYRILFRSGLPPHEAFARVRQELPGSREAEQMVAFLEKSERGFCRAQ
ncbi:MAG: acyl-ACP--UDP-N-acetylglucosamine O-acyltransferase [Myxococcota bacterium]